MKEESSKAADPNARTAMEWWEIRARPLVIMAALAPVLLPALAPNAASSVVVGVDFVSWIVFLIDFSYRMKIDRNFYRTGTGIFDLAILVLTIPFAAFGITDPTGYIGWIRVVRILRMLRVLRVGRAAQQLSSRLGNLGMVVAVTIVFCAVIVVRNEPPSSGFDSYGDGLWWAMVSLTTVGYGDLAPTSGVGRAAAVLIMVVGVGTLGTLAATLGSFFNGDQQNVEEQVLAEIRHLRTELADLRAELEAGAEERNRSDGSDGGTGTERPPV